jgi:hypothetical protein
MSIVDVWMDGFYILPFKHRGMGEGDKKVNAGFGDPKAIVGLRAMAGSGAWKAITGLGAIADSFDMPSITPRQASALALGLALVGLLLIYLWPTQSAYQSISFSSLPLLRDGQWVQASGTVDSVSVKPSGYSFRLCQDFGGCATVSVGASQALAFNTDSHPPTKGERLNIWGEVAVVQQNPFIRAHKIEEG